MHHAGRTARRAAFVAAGTTLALLEPRALSAQAPAVTPATAPAPKLVVFITVDQLAPIYLERWGAQFDGGLRRLLQGGAVYTNAFQDHANTETAPGHASTLSGRFPRGTGILFNVAGVPDPEAPLIGGGGPGASPFRFRGSTLIDWLRVRDPRSRALSVSRKDRGAILPLGRAHQSAFWYASDGRFTTSRYYADTLPTWVREFNARRLPHRFTGAAWTLLRSPSEYPERDSVAAEAGGTGVVFPHVASSDTAKALAAFIDFPWMDEVTAAMALEGVNAMQLGRGPATDLLAVSFSSTDAVGHRYGRESREVHDQVLRVDRTIGQFLDSLYRLRDSSTILVALTADHGVTSAPELLPLPARGSAHRVSLMALGRRYGDALGALGLPADAFRFDDAVLTVDRHAFARAWVNADSVIAAFAADARATPGVLRTDTPASLASADTVADPVARRWLHALPPDLPIELVVTLRPGSVWGSYATGIHGGPSDDDAHVPLILYGPPFRTGRYASFARVVDMAPTLAAVLAVPPTERLDGRVLWEALRCTPSTAYPALCGP